MINKSNADEDPRNADHGFTRPGPDRIHRDHVARLGLSFRVDRPDQQEFAAFEFFILPGRHHRSGNSSKDHDSLYSAVPPVQFQSI